MIITTTKLLRPRALRDHYPTDDATVRAAYGVLAPLLVDWAGRAAPPASILDVGAGTGPWGRGAAERWPTARLVGVEESTEPPEPSYHGWRYGDVRTMPWYERFSLVTGNPPFNIAEACVRRGLELVVKGGLVYFLLRLAFLESVGRGEGLWTAFPPRKAWVFAKRPSFTQDGRTDATAYMMCLWQEGYRGATEMGWILPEQPMGAEQQELAFAG